jgi:hypothetical protein
MPLLRLCHPSVNFTRVKTEIGTDPDNGNFIPANKSVDRAQMNAQILGYLGGRHHDPNRRGIASGLHDSLSFWLASYSSTIRTIPSRVQSVSVTPASIAGEHRVMDAHETIVHEIDRKRVNMVLQLFAERIC